MSDKIKVAIKVRPLIAREKADNSLVYWRVSENSIFLVDPSSGKGKDTVYTFDHVFDANDDNVAIFKTVAKPIVEATVKGFNGTIFAYGQTSSGKTYTMLGSSSDSGIIPSAIQHIFDCISNTPGREFLLRASYIELYNEQVNDLLTRKENLKIREPQPGEVIVAGLKEEVAHTPEKVMDLMKRGEKFRRFGETNMNDRSSRSHTIFRIIIESREAGESDGAIQVSHLNLVDLAGSERVEQTRATGERFKEGCSINRSLLTLGLVIAQLTDEAESHVSYRDSKLTRILQCSLGGNAHTSIICTVTPASVEETTCTLNFASRAKNINNKPQVNEVLTDAALLKRYTRQIALLQEQLQRNSKRPEAITEIENKLLEEQQRNEELQSRINRLKEQLIVSAYPVCGTENSKPTRRRTWCAPRGSYRMSFFPTLRESQLDTIIELDTSFPSSPVVSDSSFTSTPLEEFELQLLEEEVKSLSDDGDNASSLSVSSISETPCYVTTRRRLNIFPTESISVTLVENVCEQGIQTDIILPSVIKSSAHMLKESLETPPHILRERERYFQKEYEELREFTRLEKNFGCVADPVQKKLAENYEMLQKAFEESSNKLEYSEGIISDLKAENKELKENLEECQTECEELKKLLQPTEELNEILLKCHGEKCEMEKLIRNQVAKIKSLESERNGIEAQLNLAKQTFKTRESELVQSLKDAWETITEMEKEIQQFSDEGCKEEIKEKIQVTHISEKLSNFEERSLNTEISELSNFDDIVEEKIQVTHISEKLTNFEERSLNTEIPELSNFNDIVRSVQTCDLAETIVKSENIMNTYSDKTEFDTNCKRSLHETTSKINTSIVHIVDTPLQSDDKVQVYEPIMSRQEFGLHNSNHLSADKNEIDSLFPKALQIDLHTQSINEIVSRLKADSAVKSCMISELQSLNSSLNEEIENYKICIELLQCDISNLNHSKYSEKEVTRMADKWTETCFDDSGKALHVLNLANNKSLLEKGNDSLSSYREADCEYIQAPAKNNIISEPVNDCEYIQAPEKNNIISDPVNDCEYIQAPEKNNIISDPVNDCKYIQAPEKNYIIADPVNSDVGTAPVTHDSDNLSQELQGGKIIDIMKHIPSVFKQNHSLVDTANQSFSIVQEEEISKCEHDKNTVTLPCHSEYEVELSNDRVNDLLKKYPNAKSVNEIILLLETRFEVSNNQTIELSKFLSQSAQKNKDQKNIIELLKEEISYLNTLTKEDDVEIKEKINDLYERFKINIAQQYFDKSLTEFTETDELKGNLNNVPILKNIEDNDNGEEIVKYLKLSQNCGNYAELSIAEDNTETMRLHEKLLDKQGTIATLSEKILCLENDCYIKDKEISEVSNNLSQLIGKLREYEINILSLQLELSNLQKYKYTDTDVAEMKCKIDELSEKESENKNYVYCLMENAKTLENECSKKDVKIDELSNFTSQLSKKIKEQELIIETLKCKAASLSKFKYTEKDFIEMKNESLKERNFSEQNFIESVSSLKGSISMKDAYIKELSDVKTCLTRRIEEYELNIEKLKSEIAYLNNFKYREIDILHMKDEIKKMSEENLDNKSSIISLTENVSALESKCCKKDKEISEHLISISQSSGKIKELEQHIESLKSELSSLNVFKYTEEDWTAMKNDISLKDKTIRELKVVEAQLLQKSEEYKLEIEVQKSQILCLNGLKYTEEEAMHMQNEIEKLLKENLDNKVNLTSLTENVSDLEDKCCKNDAEMTEHVKAISQSNEKIKDLEQHIESLKSELSSLNVFKYTEEDWTTMKNEMLQEKDLNSYREISCLKNDISLKDETIRELKIVEAQLLKKVEEYKLEIDELKFQIVYLNGFKYTEEDVVHMKNEIELLLKKTDNKTSLISLTENVLSLEKECSKKDEKIAEHLLSIAQLGEKIKEFERRIESLKSELSSLRVLKYTEEDWTTMKNELLQKNDINEQSLRESVSSLKKDISLKDTNIKELKDIEAQLMKQIEEYQLKLDAQKSENFDLSVKLTNIDLNIKNMEENMSLLNKECYAKDVKIADLLGNISELNEKLNQNEHENNSLNDKILSLCNFKYTENDVTEMRDKLVELSQKILNNETLIENLTSDISILEKECSSKAEKIICILSDTTQLKEELVRSKKLIDTLDFKVNSLTCFKYTEDEVSKLKSDLHEKIQERDIIIQNFSENKSALTEQCTIKDARITELTKIIAETSKELDEYRVKNDLLKNEITSVQTSTEGEFCEIKKQVTELQELVLDKDKNIQTLNENLSTLQAEYCLKDNIIFELLNTKVQLLKEIEEYEKCIESLKSKVSTENNFMIYTDICVSEIKSKINSLFQKVLESEVTVQSLLSTLKGECTLKEDETVDVIAVASNLQEEIKNYKQNIETHNLTISSLYNFKYTEEEIAKLKVEINKLYEQILEQDRTLENAVNKILVLKPEGIVKNANITVEAFSESINDIINLESVNVSTHLNSVLDSESHFQETAHYHCTQGTITAHKETDFPTVQKDNICEEDSSIRKQGSFTINDLTLLKDKNSELLNTNASLKKIIEDNSNWIISLISEFPSIKCFKYSDDDHVYEMKNKFNLNVQTLKEYIFTLRTECSTKSDKISELENAVSELSLKLHGFNKLLFMNLESRDKSENMGDMNNSFEKLCGKDSPSPCFEKRENTEPNVIVSPPKEKSFSFRGNSLSDLVYEEQKESKKFAKDLSNDSLTSESCMKTCKHDERIWEESLKKVEEPSESEKETMESLKLDCKLKEKRITELSESVSFYSNEIKNKEVCIAELDSQISSLKKYKYTEKDIIEMKAVIDKLSSELLEKNNLIDLHNRKTALNINNSHSDCYEDKLTESSNLSNELETLTDMLNTKVNEIASYRRILTKELVSLCPTYKEKCDELNLNTLLLNLLTCVMSKEKEMCSVIEERKETELKDLQNQLSKCEEILRDLTDRELKRESWVRHLETENENLQGEINDCKIKNDNLIFKLNSQIEQNKLILQEKEEFSLKVCRLESSLLTSETEVDLLKTKLSEMHDNYNNSTSMIDSLNKRIEQLEKEGNINTKNFKDILNDVNVNYEKQIEELNKKIEILNASALPLNDRQEEVENFESAFIAEQEKCITLLAENLSLKQRILDIETELVTHRKRCNELNCKLESQKNDIFEYTDKNVFVNKEAQTEENSYELLKMENTLIVVKRSLSCMLKLTPDSDINNIETLCNMLTEKLQDCDLKLNATHDIVAEKVRLDEENESMLQFIKEQENSLYLYFQRNEELKHRLEEIEADKDNLICKLQIKDEETTRLKTEISHHRSNITSSSPMQVKQLAQENSQLKKRVSQLKEELMWLKKQTEGSDNAMKQIKAEMKAKYTEFQKQISILNSVKQELELENKQIKLSFNEIKENPSHELPICGGKSFDTVGINTDKDCTFLEHREKLEEDVKNLSIELVSRDAKITVLQLQMQAEKTNCKKRVNELQGYIDYYRNKVAELKNEIKVAQKNATMKSYDDCKQRITKKDQYVQVDTTARSSFSDMPITSGVVQEHNINKLMMKNKNLTREKSHLQRLCEKNEKKIKEIQKRLESCHCSRSAVNSVVGSSETSHSTRLLSPAEIEGQESWCRFVRDKENLETPKELPESNKASRRILHDKNI